MKQILQSLKDGNTAVQDVPAPGVRPGQLLISTIASLVSAGTERMLVDFGRANLLDKARQQPDKVAQVLDKIRTDGLVATIRSVQAKLDKPIPLGYSSAGVVIAVGDGKLDDNGKRMPMNVKAGDRVLIGKYSGQDIKVNDVEHTILREDEIRAIVKK